MNPTETTPLVTAPRTLEFVESLRSKKLSPLEAFWAAVYYSETLEKELAAAQAREVKLDQEISSITGTHGMPEDYNCLTRVHVFVADLRAELEKANAREAQIKEWFAASGGSYEFALNFRTIAPSVATMADSPLYKAIVGEPCESCDPSFSCWSEPAKCRKVPKAVPAKPAGLTDVQKAVCRELLSLSYKHGFDSGYSLEGIATTLGITEPLYDQDNESGILWDLGPYKQGLIDINSRGDGASVNMDTKEMLEHWSDFRGF